VSALHWDLPATLLSVTLSASDNTGNVLGAVLLYHRSNYYWYLKQCWTGDRLHSLGFDSESVGKIYLTLKEEKGIVLRIVDTAWDTFSANTPVKISILLHLKYQRIFIYCYYVHYE
jgi:hypothetical protein